MQTAADALPESDGLAPARSVPSGRVAERLPHVGPGAGTAVFQRCFLVRARWAGPSDAPTVTANGSSFWPLSLLLCSFSELPTPPD